MIHIDASHFISEVRYVDIVAQSSRVATLSDRQVADLRSLMADGKTKQRDAAALYGISQSSVWRLIHQKVRGAHD